MPFPSLNNSPYEHLNGRWYTMGAHCSFGLSWKWDYGRVFTSSHSYPDINVHPMWKNNDKFLEKFTSTINKRLNCAGHERKMLPAKLGCIHWYEVTGSRGVKWPLPLLQTPRANNKMQTNRETKIVRSVGFRWQELRDADLVFSNNRTAKDCPGLGIFHVIFSPFFCCSFAAFIRFFAIGWWFLTLRPFLLKKTFLSLFVCLFLSTRFFNKITVCQKQGACISEPSLLSRVIYENGRACFGRNSICSLSAS